MKRLAAFAAITISLSALVCAQQGAGERVVVPARNSSRPWQVRASVLNGSITVKAYSGKEVIVETTGGHANATARNAAGMRRMDRPGGLSVTEEDNVVTVHVSPTNPADLMITVPADTSLKLETTRGAIEVDGVNGEVEAKGLNGRMNLLNISGTVVANNLNGEIKASLRRVDASKPMSFSSLNGAIDVTLPADAKANLKMRSDRGEINSDFEIKLTSGGRADANERMNGRRRVRFNRTMYGTINGGGPEISFYTLNGTINLRKR
jgi:DUF4097 and DUF4098 domain-containing protein YvlB